jgi:hypothetical protein
MMAPMNRAALAGMAPNARASRAAAVRKALMGMKKGGSAMAECHKLEKELKHHEAMSASKAHGKASGGAIDKAETRTTIESGAKKFDKTKMDTSHKDKAHDTGEVKEGKPGGYAMGGTIEGNEGKFANTKVYDGNKTDKARGTGGVRMGNAGGFKHGGKAMKYASGGAIDSKLTRTTVEGGDWENRPANTAKAGKTNTTTGEVKEANAGGFKRGGSASKKAYATGGNVVDDGKADKMPRHFVSRPVANSLQSGTFKRGVKVGKYAEGGSSDDEPPFSARKLYTQTYAKHGKTLSQSKNAESKAYEAVGKQHGQNVLKKLQAFHKKNEQGYAVGGKVKRHAEGGLEDASKGAYDKSIGPSESEMDMAKAIRSVPRRLYQGAKSLLGGMTGADKAPGSVTKTEKSVTVAPAKKRGGSMKC